MALVSSPFEALKDLTGQFSAAVGAEDVELALATLARRFGLTASLFADFGAGEGAREAKLLSPVGVDRADLSVFAQHPILLRAQATDSPFAISQLREECGVSEDVWWSDLPSQLRNNEGFVVPVHSDGVLTWFCAFTGREPEVSERALSVISAGVHAGHALLQELLKRTVSRGALSPREAQCLRWIAAGKTDHEVGAILRISPRTVRFHINNAKVKLGVATRIQAVAKCVMAVA